MADPYVVRFADEALPRMMGSFPALLIVGPRAAGKTTTARRYAAGSVRLDNPAERAAFIADPDAALRTLPEPALLDEWQAGTSQQGKERHQRGRTDAGSITNEVVLKDRVYSYSGQAQPLRSHSIRGTI